MIGAGDERERDRDPDDAHRDLAVAAVRGVEERIRVPAIDRAAHDGDQRPDERIHQPQQRIASGQPPRSVGRRSSRGRPRSETACGGRRRPTPAGAARRRPTSRTMTTTKVTVRYTAAAPRSELLTPCSRPSPGSEQPAERRDADEIALDREEGEEAGRVEPSGVGQHERLDHDRGKDEHDRCRPGAGQDRSLVHGRDSAGRRAFASTLGGLTRADARREP